MLGIFLAFFFFGLFMALAFYNFNEDSPGLGMWFGFLAMIELSIGIWAIASVS